MIYEYAIDPELAVQWGKDRKDFRYYKSAIGIGSPRLMSEFPKLKNWRKQFYRAIADSDDNQMLRITEIFAILTEKMITRSCDGYDGNISWLENAEKTDVNLPFRAILSLNNPRNNIKVLKADDIDENPLWNIESQKTCDRNADDLANTLSNILQNCQEIHFIDPHFGPENPRHSRPLTAFLNAIINRPVKPSKIEVHTSDKAEITFFKNACNEIFSSIVLTGMTLTFKRWKQREAGEKLHERYVLSDIGGIKVGPGLDDGKPGETFEIAILDRNLYDKNWRDYVTNPAFDLSEEPVIVSGNK